MDIFIISLVAMLASLLTFFSGFGLGTILMPVMALFFPVEVAIALTGVVHFVNNMFKIVLVGKNLNKTVLLRFGIPAIIASFMGAFLLMRMTEVAPLFSYTMGDQLFEVTTVKFVIGIVLIIFSVLELSPAFARLQFGKDKLMAGGFLSGFFGGLAGIQGALRTAFLIKSGLSKEAFIATGVVIASLVDLTRLSVYASRFAEARLHENIFLLLSATLSAIIGAYFGKKALKKITMKSIQIVVAVMLIIIGLGLGAGLI